MTGISKLSSVRDQKKETCTGTKPELDGHFNMTPKVADRVLIRPVSCTEYLHQGHLWCFWIIEGNLDVFREFVDLSPTH